MWKIEGKPIPPGRFEPFEPVDVLYEFDGPRVFSLRDAEGELNLACWSDEDEQDSRYVVVPTTSAIIEALRTGGISVYEALDQPRCWLCDVTHLGKVAECIRVEFDAIPRDSLPAVGAMLLPAFEPQRLDWEGRIRELDKDRMTFDLREIEGPIRTQRFVFDEGLFNDVFQAFQEDVRVRVAGRASPVRNVARAVGLSRVG